MSCMWPEINKDTVLFCSAWIDVIFVVKDIIVIFRKIKTILILISFKRYFLHPEKSILNLRLP